ncbi:hypothetical protein PR048_014574 [Dryococelus australis]|uniref:Uncharacterized protein n=1 Tax=Dryococelus australis TaxID=614101 RepID=A0ABQ9HEK2_9NEOP|nr:hypothetical protein PR048_014574 [Dryococelus australis]
MHRYCTPRLVGRAVLPAAGVEDLLVRFVEPTGSGRFRQGSVTPLRDPDYSPPIEAKRVRFPEGDSRNVPDDAAGRRVFSGICRSPSPMHSGAIPYSPHFTLIGSQNLDDKSRPDLSTNANHIAISSYRRIILANPLSPPLTAVGLSDSSSDIGCVREQGDIRQINARGGKLEMSEKNLTTSGIVRHDSHIRKSGSDPAENRIRFALEEGERPSRYVTVAPAACA